MHVFSIRIYIVLASVSVLSSFILVSCGKTDKSNAKVVNQRVVDIPDGPIKARYFELEDASPFRINVEGESVAGQEPLSTNKHIVPLPLMGGSEKSISLSFSNQEQWLHTITAPVAQKGLLSQSEIAFQNYFRGFAANVLQNNDFALITVAFDKNEKPTSIILNQSGEIVWSYNHRSNDEFVDAIDLNNIVVFGGNAVELWGYPNSLKSCVQSMSQRRIKESGQTLPLEQFVNRFIRLDDTLYIVGKGVVYPLHIKTDKPSAYTYSVVPVLPQLEGLGVVDLDFSIPISAEASLPESEKVDVQTHNLVFDDEKGFYAFLDERRNIAVNKIDSAKVERHEQFLTSGQFSEYDDVELVHYQYQQGALLLGVLSPHDDIAKSELQILRATQPGQPADIVFRFKGKNAAHIVNLHFASSEGLVAVTPNEILILDEEGSLRQWPLKKSLPNAKILDFKRLERAPVSIANNTSTVSECISDKKPRSTVVTLEPVDLNLGYDASADLVLTDGVWLISNKNDAGNTMKLQIRSDLQSNIIAYLNGLRIPLYKKGNAISFVVRSPIASDVFSRYHGVVDAEKEQIKGVMYVNRNETIVYQSNWVAKPDTAN